MKRLYILLGAAALAAVCMTVSPEIKAQENGNRDENGKIVRGPYETNRFGDNWFISAGGGINLFLQEGFDAKIGPAIDANVGKWFTPSVGMRIGYQGIHAQLWADEPSPLGMTLDTEKDQYLQKFGYMYFHGDFLWNISNALSGYKETRFWNFVPYLHAGFFRSYGLKGAKYNDNEFAAGAGLLHNLRLTDRLDLVIDMRATVVDGVVHGADGVCLLPDDTLTREQFATILWRYAQYKELDVTLNKDYTSIFPDMDQVNDWAVDAVQWAVERGLMNGTTDEAGTLILSPKAGTARAQSAVMLMRLSVIR